MELPLLNLTEPRVRPHRALNDTVAAMLAQKIMAGHYVPEEVLPTEEWLAKSFGVSRTVVREAMKRLAAKGLVEPRKRRGTVVRPRSAWNMLDPNVLNWWSASGQLPDFTHSVMEMRMIFEPAAAALAASRADRPSISRIEHAYRRMEAVVHNAELSVEPDVDFHRAILEATGNDLLRSLGALLEAALQNTIRISNSYLMGLSLTLPDHRAVLANIARGKPTGARRAMQRLLDKTSSILDQSLRHSDISDPVAGRRQERMPAPKPKCHIDASS